MYKNPLLLLVIVNAAICERTMLNDTKVNINTVRQFYDKQA